MAIDATILGVEREGSDVVLTLGPRIDNSDKLSIAGQSKLRIIGATYEPPVGAESGAGAAVWNSARRQSGCIGVMATRAYTKTLRRPDDSL